MKNRALIFASFLSAVQMAGATSDSQPIVGESIYRGWKSQRLGNGLIELQIVPDIGGRVIQFKLADKEFLWVNPNLAGAPPSPNGLAPDGGWLNYGGDKLWPAPQGWDNDEQWPGPPDAVLDGSPHKMEILSEGGEEASVRLTSGEDKRSGIRFSRVIRIFEDSTRVSFEATMKNIDTKPRRWGIWAHTQLDAAKADGSSFNPLMNAWCPINPKSHFEKGFTYIFGASDNPSFQPDPARGLMRVEYQYKVGKIGLDSHAGWTATVDGESGAVFVQRFVFEPKKEYPDGSSVEFWHNGVGSIHAYNKEMVMAANPAENPYVFESEVLSPYARLKPGKSHTWRYDWFAANIGGDFPIVDCTSVGVVAEPLRATISSGKVSLKGRFGVFAPGTVRAEFHDAKGRRLQALGLPLPALPLKPLVIDTVVEAPPAAVSVNLVLLDGRGKPAGELARSDLQQSDAAARWPVGKAWEWYDKQPWPVGFNFVPSTAANDTEMWQAETFDPKTIDRELGWAEGLGYNSCRVFIQYIVWKEDPQGLKKRVDRFLALADKHGLSTTFVLFDDCAFGDPLQPEPFLGKQRDPIPGMILPSWTPSPGLKAVTDRSVRPDLERYIKDVVGTFGQDKRVLLWDLYNEPGGSGMGNKSLPLVEAAFSWARQAKLSQPLTIGTWGGTKKLNDKQIELSDIISFHFYGNYDGMKGRIEEFKKHGRPVICTEWMARTLGSKYETELPLFKQEKVGCYNWGLVNGRTQCQYSWASPKDAPEPEVWFHDLLRRDGSPKNPDEIAFICKFTDAPSVNRLKPLFDFPVRDTSVCLGPDKTYYLIGTTGAPAWWNTNEGIRMWKSKDLKTWEALGLVWSFEKDMTWQRKQGENQAIWAPEMPRSGKDPASCESSSATTVNPVPWRRVWGTSDR